MLYTERQVLATNICNKLKAGEKLTPEEISYVCDALESPLDEFCMREGTFRLVEILGADPEKAAKKEEAAAEVIHDIIDYDENLYDRIDEELDELARECGSTEDEEDECEGMSSVYDADEAEDAAVAAIGDELEDYYDYVVLIKHPDNELYDEYETYATYEEAKARFEQLKDALIKRDINNGIYVSYAKVHEVVFYNEATEEEYDSINL